MAKDNDNDDDDDKFEKMDEESLGYLEQVRKGKARNFVLSMKGNKVRSMIVKKKPIKEKDRKTAKGEGYQPVYGVVSGSGSQITFSVARSDGFDEKDGDRKTEKLKKFLSEQTGKMFKPKFELVDTPPAIAFDDEDLQHPLVAKFMKVSEAVTKVLDVQPGRADELLPLMNEIRELLQDGEFDPAGSKIDAIVQLLKGGAASAPPSPGSETATATEPMASGASIADLKTWLDKLKPECDVLLQNNVGDGAAIKTGLNSIKEKAAVKDFAGAVGACQQLAGQLQGEWTKQAKAILPRVKTLLEKPFAEQAGDVQKIRAVVALAQERAGAERFGSAAVAMSKLVPLLNAAELGTVPSEAEQIPEGKVERTREQLVATFQKSNAVWRKTRERLEQDLTALEDAILTLYEDHPLLDRVEASSKQLYEVLDDLDNRLSAKLAVAAKATGREQDILHQEALAIVAEYREFATNNKVMKALDTNPFMPLKTQAMLLKALDALKVALA